MANEDVPKDVPKSPHHTLLTHTLLFRIPSLRPTGTTQKRGGRMMTRLHNSMACPASLGNELHTHFVIGKSDKSAKERFRPDAKIWSLYLADAAEKANERAKRWNTGLDSLLIFAGLFASIVTSFLVESRRKLVQDEQEAVLFDIRNALRNQPPLDAGFYPAVADVWINGLHFASLFFTLFSAILGVLAKSWLVNFVPAVNRQESPDAYQRWMLDEGAERWKLEGVITTVPFMLQVAFFLFAIGLGVDAFHDHRGIGIFILVVVTASTLAYLLISLFPFFSQNVTWPFKTPLTDILLNLFGNLLPPQDSRAESPHAITVLSKIWREKLMLSSKEGNVDEAVAELTRKPPLPERLQTFAAEVPNKSLQRLADCMKPDYLDRQKRHAIVYNHLQALFLFAKHCEKSPKILAALKDTLRMALETDGPFCRWNFFPEPIRPLAFTVRARILLSFGKELDRKDIEDREVAEQPWGKLVRYLQPKDRRNFMMTVNQALITGEKNLQKVSSLTLGLCIAKAGALAANANVQSEWDSEDRRSESMELAREYIQRLFKTLDTTLASGWEEGLRDSVKSQSGLIDDSTFSEADGVILEAVGLPENLVSALGDPNPEMQIQAIQLISTMVEKGKELLWGWNYLKELDENVRRSVLQSVRIIGSNEQLRSELTQQLRYTVQTELYGDSQVLLDIIPLLMEDAALAKIFEDVFQDIECDQLINVVSSNTDEDFLDSVRRLLNTLGKIDGPRAKLQAIILALLEKYKLPEAFWDYGHDRSMKAIMWLIKLPHSHSCYPWNKRMKDSLPNISFAAVAHSDSSTRDAAIELMRALRGWRLEPARFESVELFEPVAVDNVGSEAVDTLEPLSAAQGGAERVAPQSLFSFISTSLISQAPPLTQAIDQFKILVVAPVEIQCLIPADLEDSVHRALEDTSSWDSQKRSNALRFLSGFSEGPLNVLSPNHIELTPAVSEDLPIPITESILKKAFKLAIGDGDFYVRLAGIALFESMFEQGQSQGSTIDHSFTHFASGQSQPFIRDLPVQQIRGLLVEQNKEREKVLETEEFDRLLRLYDGSPPASDLESVKRAINRVVHEELDAAAYRQAAELLPTLNDDPALLELLPERFSVADNDHGGWMVAIGWMKILILFFEHVFDADFTLDALADRAYQVMSNSFGVEINVDTIRNINVPLLNVVTAMSSPNLVFLQEACTGWLGEISKTTPLHKAVTQLGDINYGQREQALVLLGSMAEKPTAEDGCETFRHVVALKSFEAIAEGFPVKGVDAAILETPSYLYQSWANILGALKGSGNLGAVVTKIADRALKEEDDSTRLISVQILQSLLDHPDHGARFYEHAKASFPAKLDSVLKERLWTIRRAWANILPVLSKQGSVPRIFFAPGALFSPPSCHPVTRHPDGPATLIDLALKDEDYDVRLVASRALSTLRKDHKLPTQSIPLASAMETILKGSSPEHRSRAISALHSLTTGPEASFPEVLESMVSQILNVSILDESNVVQEEAQRLLFAAITDDGPLRSDPNKLFRAIQSNGSLFTERGFQVVSALFNLVQSEITPSFASSLAPKLRDPLWFTRFTALRLLLALHSQGEFSTLPKGMSSSLSAGLIQSITPELINMAIEDKNDDVRSEALSLLLLLFGKVSVHALPTNLKFAQPQFMSLLQNKRLRAQAVSLVSLLAQDPEGPFESTKLVDGTMELLASLVFNGRVCNARRQPTDHILLLLASFLALDPAIGKLRFSTFMGLQTHYNDFAQAGGMFQWIPGKNPKWSNDNMIGPEQPTPEDLLVWFMAANFGHHVTIIEVNEWLDMKQYIPPPPPMTPW
ncbi:hypothetical protein FA15DRAFT_659958 [Coprinopsis marcescibilis]|uniref:DUF6535 domain-containing protein n=1 Tax=Coprinopsis marcescibilis TaxID=230819 RepID=A0A5C3KGP6_COPMA|nr:hypothetical protein FA15DRAFT_659958 [Coprinopsis marcescibilis]